MTEFEEVKLFIISHLLQKLSSEGRELKGEITDNTDILMEGIIDSLGFLGLTLNLQEHFKVEIDFEEIDPEKMTIIGYLCRFVSEKISFKAEAEADA